MTSRFVAPARLAARLASTGITSRVAASKLFTLPPSAISRSAPRFFSQTRQFLAEPVVSAPLNDVPTVSEEVVKADLSPVDPLAETSSSSSSTPVEAEAPVLTSTAEEPTSLEAEQTLPQPGDAHPEEAAELLRRRTVFVGGLSWNVDNEWLRDDIIKELGETTAVDSVRIARTNVGKSRGFAFVELSSPEWAEKLTNSVITIDHRPTEFRLAEASTQKFTRTGHERNRRERDPNFRGATRNAPSNTVWIGNLHWSAEESDLEEVFEKFGEISRSSVPKDRETGNSRGIAYVEFADKESAIKAVTQGLDREFVISGRPLRLDYAATQRTYDANRGRGREGRPDNRGSRSPRGGRGGGDRWA